MFKDKLSKCSKRGHYRQLEVIIFGSVGAILAKIISKPYVPIYGSATLRSVITVVLNWVQVDREGNCNILGWTWRIGKWGGGNVGENDKNTEIRSDKLTRFFPYLLFILTIVWS